MNIKKYLQNLITRGNKRSVQAKKNILASFLLKFISISISLQIVPLTINYINPTQYGLWLTLSSIISWLAYFDLGLANGFRNKFAEARAKGNIILAKQYVSTTYALLALIFGFLFLIITLINQFINWSSLLNISIEYNHELQIVFLILACFFCINFTANIFSILLIADQKNAYSSLINTIGQFLAFITIYILTQSTKGSLINLALAFSGIPCIFLVIVSIFMFQFSKYKIYKPSIKQIDFKLTKDILSLGSQFFFILLSMLIIFQLINIIISRILGPESVTQYNIAFKYFNVLNMISTIILTPFWSAYTEAYTQKDYKWMKSIYKKLEILWLLSLPIIAIMILFSPIIYKWWIGDSVHIPMSLSISMGLYIASQVLGNIYMYQINGTGKVRIQLITYLSFSLISIPLLTWGCKTFGLVGILIIPTIVFFSQAIIGRIQLKKIITNTALGIWNK